MIRFLLISPSPPWDADFAGLKELDGTAVTRVPPTAIATVAAFAPQGIAIVLQDETLTPIDFDAEADFIGITANVSQLARAKWIAEGFRRKGRKVIIGGPHITLDPLAFEGLCDVAVTGEFEGVAEAFYTDMLKGELKPSYAGGRPDLSTSPVPAWDLYDNDRALIGIAQTSRGCPFECNFCDVIQYVGRVQRHKTNEQVIAEVQKLYDVGYNRIFLADDNFTVYRKRAASLLEALAAWNGSDGRGYVTFHTQVSIDIAADDRMLDLCAEAGLTNLFIGIETVNEESLKESLKRQNVSVDVKARMDNVVAHGLEPVAGLMVGFDADSRRIFEQQYEFAMRLPIGTFKVSSLSAPVGTPLYEDMLKAGRIVTDEDRVQYQAGDQITNIHPAQMTREDLYVGTRWLISRLNEPQAFWTRLQAMAALLRPSPLPARSHPHDPPGRARSKRLFMEMMTGMRRRDPAVARVLEQAADLMRERPEIRETLSDVLHNWLLSFHGQIAKGGYHPAWAQLTSPPFDDPTFAEDISTRKSAGL
jgi:radical SAM superfamily enzyme YgiQ (UPF0313 family)